MGAKSTHIIIATIHHLQTIVFFSILVIAVPRDNDGNSYSRHINLQLTYSFQNATHNSLHINNNNNHIPNNNNSINTNRNHNHNHNNNNSNGQTKTHGKYTNLLMRVNKMNSVLLFRIEMQLFSQNVFLRIIITGRFITRFKHPLYASGSMKNTVSAAL